MSGQDEEIRQLRADLAAARGEVERMKADAKKLWRRIPHPFALVPPSEGCDYCGLWRPDHGEAVQERSATPPPASAARPSPLPDEEVDAPGYFDDADVCGKCSRAMVKPPASEAPISERALSERVRWIADYVRTTTGTCGASIPCLAAEGAQILAASELAAKGEGGA